MLPSDTKIFITFERDNGVMGSMDQLAYSISNRVKPIKID